jgi:hypothetical protein
MAHPIASHGHSESDFMPIGNPKTRSVNTVVSLSQKVT